MDPNPVVQLGLVGKAHWFGVSCLFFKSQTDKFDSFSNYQLTGIIAYAEKFDLLAYATCPNHLISLKFSASS